MPLFNQLRLGALPILRARWMKISSGKFQLGTLSSQEKLAFLPGKASIIEENLPNFMDLSIERHLYPRIQKSWPQLSTLCWETDAWLTEPVSKEIFDTGRELINKSCGLVNARHPGFQPILKKVAKIFDRLQTEGYWQSINLRSSSLLALCLLPNESMRLDETVRHEINIWSFVYNSLVALLFVSDDVLDMQEFRGGKTAYYRLHPHTCGNDFEVLYSLTMYHHHATFRRHPRYPEFFLIASLYMMWSLVGQTLDFTYRISENLDDIEEAWECQASHKTGSWGVAPSAFAGFYGGAILNNSQAFKEFVAIGHEIGRLGQRMDDYSDMLSIASDDKMIFGDIEEGETGAVTVGTMIALKLVRDKPELKSQMIKGLKNGKTPEGQRQIVDVFRKVGVFKEATRTVKADIERVYGLIDEFEEKYGGQWYWVSDVADSLRSLGELLQAPATVSVITRDQVPLSDRAWNYNDIPEDETKAQIKTMRRSELLQRLGFDMTGFEIPPNDR